MNKLLSLLAIVVTLNVSAYCHTGYQTASGVWPQVGMAAADHLPFGSKVTLPDGTVVVIRDRMGGGYVDRLDIFMNSEAECWKFGRQWMRCKVEVPE